MSLPHYPDYKDSGLAWLGQVPAHWLVKPLKAIASLNDEALPETTDPDFEIEYVDIGSVSLDTGISANERFLFKGAPSRARRIVRDGDVIISTVRTYLKAIAPVIAPPDNMIVSTGFAVIRPKQGLASTFAKYALQNSGFVEEVIARSTGVSYPAINASDLARIAVPTPPTSEQTAIATFLDRETAKIDGLIAEQEKLIALLTEKRQATISHAVTKGLTPAAPMKDSGVVWLGEVPAHWEAGNLKRFAEVIDCKHHTVEFLDEGLPIVSIRELRHNRIDISNAKLTSQVEWDFLREGRAPEHGDLVFCRNASVGAVAYVNGTEQPFCMGQDVCLIRPLKKSKYMYYQLTALEITNQIESFLVGATIRRANVEEIRNLFVAWPREDEQVAIAAFLETEIARLEELTTEATRGIALLKERRSALISAAVTGKIDVRHLAEQKAA